MYLWLQAWTRHMDIPEVQWEPFRGSEANQEYIFGLLQKNLGT